MNVRNINALEEMLARWKPKGMSPTEFKSWLPVARFLVRQGVLVPSALTDEEITNMASSVCPPEFGDDTSVYVDLDRWRDELERIAKG